MGSQHRGFDPPPNQPRHWPSAPRPRGSDRNDHQAGRASMHPHHRARTAIGRRTRRLFASAAAVTLTALTVGLVPATGAHAADTSVTVDFATAGGAPSYHASGTLYGMSPDGS